MAFVLYSPIHTSFLFCKTFFRKFVVIQCLSRMSSIVPKRCLFNTNFNLEHKKIGRKSSPMYRKNQAKKHNNNMGKTSQLLIFDKKVKFGKYQKDREASQCKLYPLIHRMSILSTENKILLVKSIFIP